MSEAMAVDGLTTALRTVGLHLVGPLGAGAGGPRWGARDGAGVRWVVTVLSVRSTVHRAHLVDRVARLEQVEHEHVATVGPVLPLPGGRVAALHQEVAGTDLATVRAARGPWQPGEVVTVLVPLAGALAALHDAGLSHGDVAPGNVVLSPEGRAVLVDLVGADDPREAGTPGFAAPERARAAEPAGDVHALGRLGLYLLGRSDDATSGADGGAPTTGSAEMAQATGRLVATLRTACSSATDGRPTAIELAAQVYAVCPPVPVGQPDPSVLARLTLRRLGETTAPDRTRRVTAVLRPGQGRHRQRHRRRGLVLGCAAGVVLAVCGGTVAATVHGAYRARSAADTTQGPVDRSGTTPLPPEGLASAVPAAIRLAYARAEALAAGDRVRLREVTVPGSPAARSDWASLGALARRAAAPGGTAATGVRVSVEQVQLLPRTGGRTPRSGCRSCVRVLVVADVRAGDRTRTGGAGGESAAPGADGVAAAPEAVGSGPATGGVVLVMLPTGAGWRVSEVEPYEL